MFRKLISWFKLRLINKYSDPYFEFGNSVRNYWVDEEFTDLFNKYLRTKNANILKRFKDKAYNMDDETIKQIKKDLDCLK